MSKISVLYYSKSGNTKAMAEHITAGAGKVEGVSAKAFSIEDIDEAWVKESQCVILGSPVYMASVSAKIQTWLQNSAKAFSLAGKIGGAFATANFVHGGGDLAIRTILDHMMVFGMLTYSGGGAFGQPPIHLGPVAIGGKLDESVALFEEYGRRMATTTKAIFG